MRAKSLETSRNLCFFGLQVNKVSRDWLLLHCPPAWFAFASLSAIGIVTTAATAHHRLAKRVVLLPLRKQPTIKKVYQLLIRA